MFLSQLKKLCATPSQKTNFNELVIKFNHQNIVVSKHQVVYVLKGGKGLNFCLSFSISAEE